jgi:hypothetical protein
LIFFKKNSHAVLILQKSSTFAVSKLTLKSIKDTEDEKDISAIEKKKGKQAWFQGENVDPKWQESSCSPQSKRQEETYCFKRA